MFKNAISKFAFVSSISLASFYVGRRSVPAETSNINFYCESDDFKSKVSQSFCF